MQDSPVELVAANVKDVLEVLEVLEVVGGVEVVLEAMSKQD